MPLALDAISGCLLQGRHVATLQEVHDLFVLKAPHSQHRLNLFNGLVAWVDSVKNVVAIDRIWLDGGFLTHKQSPPDDVDVVGFVAPGLYDGHLEAKLSHLTTQVVHGVKVRPMGDRVDAYVVPARLPDIAYWAKFWSGVRGEPDLTKGFVEVC